MAEKEKELKADIVRAAASIRKKYRELQQGIMAEETEVKRRYEPLLKPLETIIDLTKSKDDGASDQEDAKITQGPEKGQVIVPRFAGRKHKLKNAKSILSTMGKRSVKKTERRAPARVGADMMQQESKPGTSTSKEEVYESIESGDDNEESFRVFRNYIEKFGPLTQAYMWASLTGNQHAFDRYFGVNFDPRAVKWTIGNKEIMFDKDDFIHLGENQFFMGTRGLFELMFKRFPDISIITERDKQNYEKILLISSAHKQANNPNAPLKSGRSDKFKKIISQLPGLFKEEEALDEDEYEGDKTLIGSSYLPVTNNKIDYVHWNDPNELVQRLALLLASEEAGNRGHKIEIASLEEELREEGIIV